MGISSDKSQANALQDSFRELHRPWSTCSLDQVDAYWKTMHPFKPAYLSVCVKYWEPGCYLAVANQLAVTVL